MYIFWNISTSQLACNDLSTQCLTQHMEYDVYSFSYNPATGNVWATLPDSTAQALHSHWNSQVTSFGFGFWSKIALQDVEAAVSAASRAFPAWSGLTPEVMTRISLLFCHFTIPYMFHNHVGVFSMLSNITPHPTNPPNLDKMANFRIILTVWKMSYDWPYLVI